MVNFKVLLDQDGIPVFTVDHLHDGRVLLFVDFCLLGAQPVHKLQAGLEDGPVADDVDFRDGDAIHSGKRRHIFLED